MSPPGRPTKRTKSWEQLSGCWLGGDGHGGSVRRPDVCQRDCGRQEEVLKTLQIHGYHQGNVMCRLGEDGRLSGTVCTAGEQPVTAASAVLV